MLARDFACAHWALTESHKLKWTTWTGNKTNEKIETEEESE